MPYFDLTVSAVKSVSVLHASYRTAARQARDRGDEDQAAALDAKAQRDRGRADGVGAGSGRLAGSGTRPTPAPATTPPARGSGGTATAWPPACSCITSAATATRSSTSTWRSGTGSSAPTRPTASGAPWTPGRCTASGSASPPVADRLMETRLTGLGYVMVPRADGNGAEVGGVGQDVMDLFSSRAVADHRGTEAAGRRVRGQPRQPAEPAHAVAAAPAGRAEHPPHQGRGAPHPRRADRQRRTHRRRAAGRLGSPDHAPGNPGTVRRYTSRSPQYAAGHADRAPAVLDDAAKRTAARIAVAEVQQHHAVWSMAQLRFEVHRALPVLPAGADADAVITEVAELAVSGRAGTERGLRDRPRRHRRDQPRCPRLRRRQHLPAAARGPVLHPGPPRHRRTDPRRRQADRARSSSAEAAARAAVDRGPGSNAEQAAAVVMMLTAADGGHGADRPGRGGQEPHHGRVRRAVGTAHRPAGDRPDHLHQRRPGTGERGPGRVLQHRRVPRQNRRQRRAAPPRPAAPGRRARDRRGQPGQHRRPGHAPRGRPAGRAPGSSLVGDTAAARRTPRPGACSGCWPRRFLPPS